MVCEVQETYGKRAHISPIGRGVQADSPFDLQKNVRIHALSPPLAGMYVFLHLSLVSATRSKVCMHVSHGWEGGGGHLLICPLSRT